MPGSSSADNEPGPIIQRIGKDGKSSPRASPAPASTASSAADSQPSAIDAAKGRKPITSHDLRRTFVTLSHKAGMDVFRIADVAGHSSVDTTRRYDRPDVADLEEVTKAVPVPF
jgi:integrase